MPNLKIEQNNKYTVDPLYQWDIDQTLTIYGLSLSRAPEIHFTNDSMNKAIVRQATMDSAGVISVKIPNSVLQTSGVLLVYVCVYDNDEFNTRYAIRIPVKYRKKPYDYTLEVTDEEIYSFNALENLVNATVINLTAQYTEAKQYVDNAVAETKADITNIENDITNIENDIANLNSAINNSIIVTMLYVDLVAGSDTTGDGTKTNPWKTIPHTFRQLAIVKHSQYWIYVSGDPVETNVVELYDEGLGVSGPISVRVIFECDVELQAVADEGFSIIQATNGAELTLTSASASNTKYLFLTNTGVAISCSDNARVIVKNFNTITANCEKYFCEVTNGGNIYLDYSINAIIVETKKDVFYLTNDASLINICPVGTYSFTSGVNYTIGTVVNAEYLSRAYIAFLNSTVTGFTKGISATYGAVVAYSQGFTSDITTPYYAVGGGRIYTTE